jgi:hypothetical protein
MSIQNEQELARKIASRLDSGTDELRQGTAYRLQLARQAALARMAERADAPKRAPALELATATAGGGNVGGGGARSWLTDYRLWLGILVIAGGIYFYDYWTIIQQASEIAELDSALLGSDLPVDALLDKGFENWLIRSGQ